MRKAILSLALALMLLFVFAVPIFAATSDTVSVTATPAFISISVAPDSYSIGGAGATLAPNTTYYANPGSETTAPSATVLDTECVFAITNTSTVATDITVNFPHFTGGDAMQNIGTGYTNNGANSFGVSGYAEGAAWPGGAVTFLNAGSGVFIDGLAATTDIDFGWALLTQTGDWTTGTAMTSTVSVSAAVDA